MHIATMQYQKMNRNYIVKNYSIVLIIVLFIFNYTANATYKVYLIHGYVGSTIELKLI